MRKKLILSIIAVAAILSVALGYRNINAQYPRATIKEAAPGETLEYQKGVYISADSITVLSDEETAEITEMLGTASLFETKIYDVTITLENTTDQELELVMTDLNLATSGAAGGISRDIIEYGGNRYGSLRQTLEPGEKRQITFPYSFNNLNFTKHDWAQFEEREFWLTFSEYPVKSILRME